MKTTFFALCLCALVYTSVHAESTENGEEERIVAKVFDYIRTLLKKAGHYSVPYEVNDHFRDFIYNMHVNLDQIQLSKADDFVVKNFHIHEANLSAEFLLEFPSPVVSAGYNITGTSFGKKANAFGKAQWNVQNFYLGGSVQIEPTEGSISMKNLELDYVFGNQTFEMEQTSAEGWSTQQVNSYLHQKSPFFMTLHREAVCQNVAEQVKNGFNKMIGNKNIIEIIQWLENSEE